MSKPTRVRVNGDAKPARTPVIDAKATSSEPVEKRDAAEMVDDLIKRDANARLAVVDEDETAADLTEPPITIERGAVVNVKRADGGYETSVTVIDAYGVTLFGPTKVSVEGMSRQQRVEYRAACAVAEKSATHKRKEEEEKSVKENPVDAAIKGGSASTGTTKRGRGRPASTDDDAKYGPMRDVERVLRTEGKRDVFIFKECGHEGTQKSGMKRARCRKCKNVANGKTEIVRPKRERVTDKPARQPVTETGRTMSVATEAITTTKHAKKGAAKSKKTAKKKSAAKPAKKAAKKKSAKRK